MRAIAISAVISVLFLTVFASAQVPPEAGAVIISDNGPPLPHAKAGMVTMRVDGMDAEAVKGSPFCATIATEHTQLFADGNRIHTTENSTLCRDSEGRIRREAELNLLGAGQQSAAPKLTTIVDPVAGYRYLLDSENKIAHKLPIAPPGPGFSTGPGTPGKANVMLYQRTGPVGPELSMGGNVAFKAGGDPSDEPAPRTESLGDQEINGIHATGTRVTTTIPAGKMGNEQAMTVSSERWYSPELKTTVMTKHTDPWAGTLTTEFKDVNTATPDPSLFVVPSDYKIIDGKNGPFFIQKRLLAPATPQ